MKYTKLLLPSLLAVLLFSNTSCKKDQAHCSSIRYVGEYSGILSQTINDPNFDTEIYMNDECELFIDFCPDLGHHTQIEIVNDQVRIPLQTTTFDDVLTFDSTAFWQLQISGEGSYNDGAFILHFTKKSNFYTSSTFEPYSSNSVILTLQP